MPARHFTQTGDVITTGLGTMGFAFGPGTIAAVVRRTATPSGSGMFIIWAGASNSPPGFDLALLSSGVVNLSDAVGNTASTATLTVNKWYLVAISKASGTVAGRAHIYDYVTNTWTHQACTGTIANSGVPTTKVSLGNAGSGSGFGFDGDIAAIGVWNVVLSDDQVEALAYDLHSWFAPAQPKGLWLLDQDSTSQKVIDLSGGGANQSGITGTSLSSTSVPVFNYGHAHILNHDSAAAAGSINAPFITAASTLHSPTFTGGAISPQLGQSGSISIG